MSAATGACHRTCLIVPCYNEAARLDVQRFRHFLAESGSTRLVFVDDGSRDETIQVLEQLCRGYEECAEILRGDTNRGKAEAVRLGIIHALDTSRQEFVGYWDADLATPLESIAHFVSVLDERPEIEMVFGSRVKLLGRYVERRAVRHYLGRIFATAVSSVLSLSIYDSQCGAKLFRVTPHTRQIFAEPFLSKWVFDVEIIARYQNLYARDARRLEKAVYEYPLEVWVDVAGSKVHPTDFLKAFIDIVRIRHKYFA